MPNISQNTLKGRLMGYALIAFALAMGHACAQGIVWIPPMEPDNALVSFTSVSASEAFKMNNIAVGRNGLAAAARDGLEQPLMINNTECGSYAVSREVNYNFSHALNLLSI